MCILFSILYLAIVKTYERFHMFGIVAIFHLSWHFLNSEGFMLISLLRSCWESDEDISNWYQLTVRQNKAEFPSQKWQEVIRRNAAWWELFFSMRNIGTCINADWVDWRWTPLLINDFTMVRKTMIHDFLCSPTTLESCLGSSPFANCSSTRTWYLYSRVIFTIMR